MKGADINIKDEDGQTPLDIINKSKTLTKELKQKLKETINKAKEAGEVAKQKAEEEAERKKKQEQEEAKRKQEEQQQSETPANPTQTLAKEEEQPKSNQEILKRAEAYLKKIIINAGRNITTTKDENLIVDNIVNAILDMEEEKRKTALPNATTISYS